MNDDRNCDEEMAQANLELQQLLWLSLDRCQKAGAREDDLKFLAWGCGCTNWAPRDTGSRRVG